MDKNFYSQQTTECSKRKVSFVTLGCKVNQYDTDAMRDLFLKRGYVSVQEGEADVYVINTCSVTQTGDKKSRQMIRRIHREHPRAVIAVSGCYAQLAPDEIKKIDGVGVVVGTQNRARIVDYAEEAMKGRTVNAVSDIMECREFEELPVDGHDIDKTRAFMKIQEGCNNYCTFCIIPYARGRLKSRNPRAAVQEAARLVEEGYKEIVLTGIHLGNYGVDMKDGTSLASLVKGLLSITGLKRIRLGSIESVELSPELIQLLRSDPRVCPHLHLPIQSGSDSILRGMNRHYRLHEYKALIRNLRSQIPGLALTTDLIVGFPGETEELFQETLDTLDELRFSAIHVFPYSKRQGTPAASFPDQVTESVKHERVRQVQEREALYSLEYRSRFIGKTVSVLAEEEKNGLHEGLSDTYIRVRMKGKEIKRGHIYQVHIQTADEEGLEGIVEKEDES